MTSLKTKQTKTFTNTDDLTVLTGSMDNAKKGNLLLDEDGSDLIDCNMWITFQDGSYQKYFVWVMDNDGKDVIIANQSNLTSLNLTFYHLSEANAKQVDNLLKDIL